MMLYALSPRAGSQKQVADVLEPRRDAVDQVFRLARAIDAAADLHFVGIERQKAAAVVES